MDREEILKQLNPEQAEAVFETEGPVLILAGAGSGKTRVLVHRIAYLIDACDVLPGNILAITFTNKAASEMRERVDSIIGFGSRQIWVSTFHSLCVRILRENADLIGFTRSFSIYDTDDQVSLMKDILKRKNIDSKKVREKTVLSAISSAKDELIDPEKYRSINGGDYWSSMIADLYSAYQSRLLESNAMDFDDLIVRTIELFQKYPEVLERYQDRFMYLMVDEYQDTNTAQFKFVSMLAKKYRNLCVVGDDDQSIYKFRGANIRNILDFEKVFPDAKIVRLEQNYRSSKNILDAANEVISHNRARKAKKLWTDRGEGEKVRYRAFGNGFEEAEYIAADILKMERSGKYNWKDCAVLYRTNAQSRLLEEKMLLSNIPYKIVGGLNFYARREIKDILAYLKTIDNAVDDIAVKRIINVPKRGIGATTIAKLDAYAEAGGVSFFDAVSEVDRIAGISSAAGKKIDAFADFIAVRRSRASSEKISEIIRDVADSTGYTEALENEDTDESRARLENIDELISKAVQYEENSESPSLSGFLEEVALVADIDSVEEDDNRVLLMTLHSAKGLEFPVVYMAGMEEGLFPSMMSINAEDPEGEIEEERRLAYVGITRAKELLTLTYARQRMVRGDIMESPISRFVKEIPREMVDTGNAGTAGRRTSFAGGGLDRGLKDAFSGSGSLPFGKSFDAFKAEKRSSDNGWGSFDVGGSSGSGYGSGSYGRRKQSAYNNPYKQTKQPASKQPVSYDVGDTVRHVKFGEGVVKDIRDGGRDYEVTVEFAKWGQKKMFASFAKLQKI
ncbi:MAG: DNA helicase PcrA [Lachnospiraceae bacterium]|nr:DNA helicase PcrA [Lachnospiraceae bacterium]